MLALKCSAVYYTVFYYYVAERVVQPKVKIYLFFTVRVSDQRAYFDKKEIFLMTLCGKDWQRNSTSNLPHYRETK